MSGTQTGAVPIKQLIPNNVQSTTEQRALVSVYIKWGSIVCQGSDQPCLTFSSSVCVLSVRYKVPSPVLPAVLVCCVVSGAPSNKAWAVRSWAAHGCFIQLKPVLLPWFELIPQQCLAGKGFNTSACAPVPGFVCLCPLLTRDHIIDL